jgi:hypothetical protein
MIVCFEFANGEKYVKAMVDVPRTGENVRINKNIKGEVANVVWDVDKNLAETQVTVYLKEV